MKKVRIMRSRKKSEFAAPTFLPGMRGSADWHVRLIKTTETPHTINLMGGKGEMILPPANTQAHKFVRLHELLHAAHSPVESPRPVQRLNGTYIRADALLVAEEFRINLFARTLLGKWTELPDQDVLIRTETLAMLEAYKKSQLGSIIVDLLKWMMVSWALDYKVLSETPNVPKHAGMMLVNSEMDQREPHDVMLFAAREIWYNVWDEEFMELANDLKLPSWKSVLKLGAFLSDIFDSLEAPTTGEPGEGEGDEIEDPDIQEARARTYSRRRVTPTKIDQLMEMLRGNKQEYDIRGGGTLDPVWGPMDIRKGILNLKLPKNYLARSKFRASDEGANPRYPHRLLTDGKVFSRKKRSNGGSVLIDDSGSMSWTTEELVNILKEAPAVNIAAYSGFGAQGELVILAEKGKYADMENPKNHPMGGDNLVDLPALEWLASQPSPRLWVSDTMVTLLSGNAQQGFEQCIQLCKDYAINIVATPQEAGEVFRGEKVIYR